MQANIFWSKDAYKGDPNFVRLDDQGQPHHPIREGYISTAFRIFYNPQDFSERDIRKAINVFKSNDMKEVAARLDLKRQLIGAA